MSLRSCVKQTGRKTMTENEALRGAGNWKGNLPNKTCALRESFHLTHRFAAGKRTENEERKREFGTWEDFSSGME